MLDIFFIMHLIHASQQPGEGDIGLGQTGRVTSAEPEKINFVGARHAVPAGFRRRRKDLPQSTQSSSELPPQNPE